MISEGSRDTEDWSNDPENSALHHRNTGKCINNEFIYIYIYIYIYILFAALVHLRVFFQKSVQMF